MHPPRTRTQRLRLSRATARRSQTLLLFLSRLGSVGRTSSHRSSALVLPNPSSLLGVLFCAFLPLLLTLFSNLASFICRYILLQPLLQIFAKSPSYTAQTVLHALFLPTPFKLASSSTDDASAKRGASLPSVEALKPGALYADCSVVGINLSKNLLSLPKADAEPDAGKKGQKKAKEKAKEGEEMEDDGEYGGREMGQFVWESFEASLKAREKAEVEASAKAEAGAKDASDKKDS